METRKVRAKVIGKWIKKGWIFKEKPMLSVEFVDGDMEPKYYDMPVRHAFWYKVEVGDYIRITMELDKDDGLWYPV